MKELIKEIEQRIERINEHNYYLLKDVLEQLNNQEYDSFDDYLEIVLEFGYLVLFAECFPLAPLMILITNTIELRSDIFKISTVFRRPSYIRKRNIGIWQLILKILSVISVFTNLLFTITFSDNSYKSYYGHKLNAGQLLNFFLLEHFVFIVVVLIRVFISSEAKWVKLFLQRREFKLRNNRI
jgi:anoctamin-10